ncbi:MAG: hypothetical protein WBN93_14515 [Acidimicrobiia bacterium]
MPLGLGGAAGGDSDSRNTLVGFAAVAIAFALMLGAFLAIRSQRRPTYGAAATSGAMIGLRRRKEERKVTRQTRSSRGVGIRSWWRTSGPVVAYHEWRATRHATKTVRRQIEERQRLRRERD